MTTDLDLRYPTGRFSPPERYTWDWRRERIAQVAAAPAEMRAAVHGLTGEELDTPYRAGGWTVRQVVHHVPDSHMNAYVRHKLALTEQVPMIKPYDEAEWAKLADTRATPIEVSLALLEALHTRWVAIWQAMSTADFERRYTHPETGEHPLDYMLGLYSWHGRHHIAHVTTLRDRMGWR
jgi:hypothetical protein